MPRTSSNRLNCCAASIVFDTGPETHPDGPVEIKGKGGKSGNLCHRIGKYLGLNLDELIWCQRRIYRNHLNGPNGIYVNAEMIRHST